MNADRKHPVNIGKLTVQKRRTVFDKVLTLGERGWDLKRNWRIGL